MSAPEPQAQRGGAHAPSLAFRLPLDPARLLRARQRVRDYLYAQAVDSLTVEDVVLAIQEAMSNVVAHSAAAADLEVRLHFEGDDLLISVRDHGCGFDDCGLDLTQCPPLDEPSHRGLYMIAQLMDELEIRQDGGVDVRAVRRGARRRPEAESVLAAGEHSRQRELAALEEIDEGFFSLDWEYRYLVVNAAFERSLGRLRTELIGSTIWEAFPDLSEHQVGRAIRDAMELGRPIIIEYLSPAVKRWLELRVYPGASGVTGYLREIDERKRKEVEREALLAALRESQAGFSAVFEESPFATALTRKADNTVVRVNRAFLSLFDVAAGEVVGRPGNEMGAMPEDAWRELNETLDDEGRVRDFEFELVSPSGGRRRLSVNVDELMIGGEPHALATVRDVTAHREIERALLESTADLERAQEVGGIGSWRLDVRENRLIWSGENYRIFGIPQGTSLSYETFLDVVHPDDRAYVDERWRGAQRGEPYDIEHRIVVGDEVKWVREKAFLERDEAGDLRAGFGITQDVSERVRAEQALRESEQRYRELVEFANSAIIRWRRDGTIVFFNEYAEQLFGWTAEEAVGMDVGMLVPDLETTGVELSRLVADIVERPELFARNTNENLCKDGHRVWVAWTNRAIYGADGDVSEILAVGTNVTEEHLAFEALRDSEAKNRAAFAHAAIGFSLSAADGRVLDANPALCAITGYSLDELLGRVFADLVHPDDAAENRAQLQRMLAGEINDFVIENRYVRKLGDVVWVRKSLSLARDERGAPKWMIALVEDISERKQAEQALRTALEERTKLAEERARQARRLSLLAEVAKTASSALEVTELAERLVEAVHRLLEVSHVGLALPDEEGNLRVVVVRGLPEGEVRAKADASPWNPLAEVYRSGERLLVANRDDCECDERLMAWAERAGVASFAVLPLIKTGRPVGVLGIGWPRPRGFSPEDVSLFELMASEIAVGLENARSYETEHRVALMLRQNFLHPLPTIEGLDLALLSLPARRPDLVGGDFHDVFELNDGRVCILIGDVMGKGVRAAGLAETVRSAVRAVTFLSTSPAKILGYVNRMLLALDNEGFASALLIVVDTARGRARAASAGHPPPVLAGDGAARFVEPEYGPLLGAFSRDYTEMQFAVPRGAVLVLYTDGVTEARCQGECFGEDRLLATLADTGDLSCEEIVERVREAVAHHTCDLRDDLEIIAFRQRV